jgi:hypothetical protein
MATRDSPPPALPILRLLRADLSVLLSVVNICSLALQAQSADFDIDVSHVLRYCVCEHLSRLIHEIDCLIAQGAV